MSETEITTSRPVTFQVRSPAPGAMGPTELAPGSDVALVEVATHLREHPELTRVSIEVRVNGLKTSSTPAVKWAVSLGQQVARRLVQQGVDCKRLEIVGYADLAPDGPAEQVRFRSGVTAEQGALTASACQAE